jgi:hypothetical protein
MGKSARRASKIALLSPQPLSRKRKRGFFVSVCGATMGVFFSMNRKTYVVHRREWEYNDEFMENVGSEPVKAFPTQEDAEAYRKTLEREAWKEWSVEWGEQFPMCLDDLSRDDFTSLTSLTPEEFLEKIKPFSLPEITYLDCMYDETEFWNAVNALPTEQFYAFYDLLDHLQFYEVIELDIS